MESKIQPIRILCLLLRHISCEQEFYYQLIFCTNDVYFYNSAITLNEAPQDSFYCLSSFICSKIKCIDNMGIGQLQTK